MHVNCGANFELTDSQVGEIQVLKQMLPPTSSSKNLYTERYYFMSFIHSQ